ncbi:hypothetical protein AwDysgo_10250 [Bacteroidales bacterium]|nr:hypothetical protein AwDysgo_10250 [Bacteroidales bacterium]
MKTISTLLICIALLLASCNEKRPDLSCETFAELPDPTDDILSDWTGIASGMHASFVSIDTRYPKSVAPQIAPRSKTELVAWRGERVSAQLLLWSADSISQVECEFSDFKSPTSTMPSSVAEARFVRYVMTDIFAEGCGHRKPEDFPASLSADMLDNLACMNIDPKTVRPVWISVDVPASAAEGTYNAELKVYAKNNEVQKFDIQIEVQAPLLPEASQWNYHLDLWQHPSAVARVGNLKPWSDEHYDAMKPIMSMLAQAGQKVITCNLNKDPWNGQCYDMYEDMIMWNKNADNTWTYDYSIFDKWVQFMMDLGVTKQINCYSMVPWNNELHYKDAATDKMITVKADPGTKIFEDMWTPFLKDFVSHLRQKGWLEITCIAMDERSPADMKATLGLAQEVAPELGISLADNHKSYKQYPYIKDMCVSLEAPVEAEILASRKAKGLTTTYYVCCSHEFPNVFTFSEPAEAAYSAWYTSAAGLDGYLRWAYNSWTENPLLDSRFRTWPAGDTYIVYPDARSSIRFERMREGIQDAEKIAILRKQFENSTKEEDKAKLNALNACMEAFKSHEKPSEACHDVLNAGKKVINELSR